MCYTLSVLPKFVFSWGLFMMLAYVSIFEFLFNEVLIVQWAMFLWYTLTPRWSKKTTILCYLPICLIAPFIPYLLPSRSVVRMFSVPAIMILSAFACYRSRPIRTLFCAFYPQLATIVCEALILLIFPTVYQNNYDSTQFWLNSKAVLLALFYLPVYSLMVWSAASCLGKTRYQLTVRQWLIFLFFPLSQTLMICFVYNTMFLITPTTAQLCLLAGILAVCIAADFALLRTISDAGRKAELEATNRMLEKQLNMQLSHYTALTSQYEANRRIRHDILHHVNTIRYLLANGQQQEATEYAGQLLAENQRSSQLGQCDNPVIDAFLYGRVQEAKAQGITVETHIILPVELPVSNTDLVIVFGNLMDNAVEACAKLENPKIELNAHIEKGYLVITESNPAVPEPEGRKQRRIPELERGVGMQILKTVAEKYQGSCMSETGNGNYSVSVFLKLGQAKEGNAIYAENSCV